MSPWSMQLCGNIIFMKQAYIYHTIKNILVILVKKFNIFLYLCSAYSFIQSSCFNLSSKSQIFEVCILAYFSFKLSSVKLKSLPSIYFVHIVYIYHNISEYYNHYYYYYFLSYHIEILSKILHSLKYVQ